MDGRTGRATSALLATLVVAGLTVAAVPLGSGWFGAPATDAPDDATAGEPTTEAAVAAVEDTPDADAPGYLALGSPRENETANATLAHVAILGPPSDSFDRPPRLWTGERPSVSVRATTEASTDANVSRNVSYAVCVAAEDHPATVCKPLERHNETYSTTISISAWSVNTTETRWLNVSLRASTENTTHVVDSVNTTVEVLVRDEDTDSDGLTNEEEFAAGTDYNDSDTDDDGVQDGPETKDYGTDPLSGDTDDDGARDGVEIRGETNPTDPDTDGDGLLDGQELDMETDPTDPDTDDDGLEDGAELERDTSPTNPDSDGDGLEDGREVEIGTDPTDVDTDGDLLRDGFEHRYGLGATSAFLPVVPVLAFLVLLATVAAAAVRKGVVDLPTYRINISAGDSSDATGGGEPAAATDATGDSAPMASSKTLSDDERILHLLESNDGRMKQSEIVERTEWSKAKVSRTLSRMQDQGNIRKLRIGRENLITLADDVPDIAR
jgi:hypothetical protein